MAHLLRSGTPGTPPHTLDSPAKIQSGSQSGFPGLKGCIVQNIIQIYQCTLYCYRGNVIVLYDSTDLCSQVVTSGQVFEPEQAVPVACTPSTWIMLHNLISEHTPVTSRTNSYSLFNSCCGLNYLICCEVKVIPSLLKLNLCLLQAYSQP